MIVRLETLYRNRSDELTALTQLVNLDHVIHLHAEGSESDEAMMLVVQFAGTSQVGRYYFGPLDMTQEEADRRLTHLQTAPTRATNTSWRRSADVAARKAGEALPID